MCSTSLQRREAVSRDDASEQVHHVCRRCRCPDVAQCSVVLRSSMRRKISLHWVAGRIDQRQVESTCTAIEARCTSLVLGGGPGTSDGPPGGASRGRSLSRRSPSLPHSPCSADGTPLTRRRCVLRSSAWGGAPLFCRLHSPAVKDRGTRALLPPDRSPHLAPQGRVDPLPGPVALPAPEVVVRRPPRWQVAGEKPLRTANPQEVIDPVEHLAPIDASSPPARVGRGDQRVEERPLRIGEITRVGSSFRTRLAVSSIPFPHTF
jgi:hypothetical protein